MAVALVVVGGLALWFRATTDSQNRYRDQRLEATERELVEQKARNFELSAKVGANEETASCNRRAAAADAEATGAADDFLRQSIIDRAVAGQPIPERSGEMFRLNAAAKEARARRVAAATACTADPNFIPK